MQLAVGILFAVFVQNITAQAISYVQRIANPGDTVLNNQQQHIITNSNQIGAVQNNGVVRSIPNGVPNGMVNNVPYLANVANAQISANEHQVFGTSQDSGANLASVQNANHPNGIPNTNLAKLQAAGTNVASINGNMATFNVGNSGFTVTSGSPSSPGFGIQVSADALEVGGKVAVNGQIPIFGAVTLNGQLPTDGAASVNYVCEGQRQPLDGA